MASVLRQYRVGEVANVLSLSVREVWRLVARQELTPPAKIGRCSVWFESDIADFQARLLSQRERRGA
jgi:hypothetical protein